MIKFEQIETYYVFAHDKLAQNHYHLVEYIRSRVKACDQQHNHILDEEFCQLAEKICQAYQDRMVIYEARSKEMLFVQPIITSNIEQPGYRVLKISDIAEHLYRSLQFLYDPELGIFDQLYRFPSSIVPTMSVIGTMEGFDYDGHGRNPDLRNALAIGILEGIERYCGAFHAGENPTYSEQQLAETEICYAPLDVFMDYTEANYAHQAFHYRGYQPTEEIQWHECIDLVSDEQVLLPEQQVFFASEYISGEPRYKYNSSNGVAIGTTQDESIVSAMLELIERDSFLVYFYTQSKPPEIEDYQSALSHENLIKLLEDRNIAAKFYDITLETGVPAVMSVLTFGKSSRFKYYITAAAGLRYDEALRSALMEGITSYNYFLEKVEALTDEQLKEFEDYNNIETLSDHIMFYSTAKGQKELKLRLEGNNSVKFGNLHSKFADATGEGSLSAIKQQMIQAIAKHHESIIYCNLSNHLSLALGLHISRIIIPTMQDISFGYQHTNVNEKRLAMAIELNNLDGHLSESYPPHPFP